jgi:tRNA threonylcarbamoyladenosine biosynthesis protein TsaE
LRKMEKQQSFLSNSPLETEEIGAKIAKMLHKGSVVALRGGLGAGKTCITRGIAGALGVEERVTSPTYTIVSEYEAQVEGEKVPFYHIDAYRLQGEDDFEGIGGEEMLYGGGPDGAGICVIEWSERIAGLLPGDCLTVALKNQGGDVRRITIEGKYERTGI